METAHHLKSDPDKWVPGHKPETKLGCLPLIAASLVLWAIYLPIAIFVYRIWIAGAFQ